MPFLDLEEARLHYREWGTGPLTVAVHGLGLDSRLWELLPGHLPGRRFVALNLRGYGPSSGVGGQALSVESLADDVATAIRALGGTEADLLGFSMGGFVLLALWERSPHIARSLALIGARANADSDGQRAGRERQIACLLDEGRHRFASDFLPQLTAADPDSLVAARLRDLLEAVPYETLVSNLRGLQQRPSRMDLLERISVPTLIAMGEHDAFLPRSLAEDMAGRVPGSTLAVLPGVGHSTPLEAPAALAGVLADFWRAAGG